MNEYLLNNNYKYKYKNPTTSYRPSLANTWYKRKGLNKFGLFLTAFAINVIT